MNKKIVHAIGLMSGTSLDGLDIVYVEFDLEHNYNFRILANDTIAYSNKWRKKLQSSIDTDEIHLNEIDNDFGVFLGEKTKEFISVNKIEELDFIASHGHTVFHQPEKGITLQIGNGQLISNITNSIVVCDFRSQDVDLGGQGAPLVPIGDQLLFSKYDTCLNLGGFANISFERNKERIAFDICPVNTVLNHFSKKLGYEYDDKGLLASKGTLDKNLLKELNELDFYMTKPPKSLGVEWVNEKIFPILEKTDSESIILRTFTEHIATQIALLINDFNSVLITGGGVYNDFLIDRIKDLTTSEIHIPNHEIINYKEALIFALLGYLKLQNKVNCLASVTGAKKNHSSGRIFHPNYS